MAHALAAGNGIDSIELSNILQLLQVEGRIWNFFTEGTSITVFCDKSGSWRWHIQDGYEKVIASSNSSFPTPSAAKRNAERIIANVPVRVVRAGEELHSPDDEGTPDRVV